MRARTKNGTDSTKSLLEEMRSEVSPPGFQAGLDGKDGFTPGDGCFGMFGAVPRELSVTPIAIHDLKDTNMFVGYHR
jgi:hypothetical protein